MESGGTCLACESQCACLTNIAVVTNTGVTIYPALHTETLALRVFFIIIEITIAREVREILPAVIGMPTVVVVGAIAFPNAAVI